MDFQQVGRETWEKLQDRWQTLPSGQRLLAMCGGLTALFTIVGLLIWASQPDMAAVFTNLGEQDAAAITAKLKESKTAYQLSDNGATILVPRASVHDVRLQLAGQGLPQSGTVGFEVFDKTNLGLTDFAQHLNFQRGLEGELTRTIGKLNGVEQARVHIVIPKATLYTDREKPATASIVLKLKPGAQLTTKQVEGVVHLVSSSVEGLKPDNVTVVDINGNVLSRPNGDLGGESTVRATAAQIELQRAYERTVERGVQEMLDRVVGPGRSAIRVSATLDWNRTEEQKEQFAPNGEKSPVRSSREASEHYLGTAPSGGPGGVPGVTSNVPGAAPSYPAGTKPGPSSTQTAPGDYERREITSNYELSRSVEKSVRAPGAVKRLSVSIVLDATKSPEQLKAIETATDQQRQAIEAKDQEQTKAITAMAEAAAGIDTARGDKLMLTSVPFDRATTEKLQSSFEEQAQWASYESIARIVAPAIALIAFLFFFLRILRPRAPRVEIVRPGGQAVAAAMAIATGGRAAALPPVEDNSPEAIAARATEAALIEERKKRQVMLNDVIGVSREQPRALANVIQAWLDRG